MVLIGESFFTSQANSAMVSTLSLTIRKSAPCWMATAQAVATRGDFIAAVIRARRRAIQFMREHPEEAGAIIAKPFNITPEVATSAIKNLINSTTQGIPYWGEGDIHLDGMKRIIEVQKSVGALTGDIDLSKVIDTRFLPDDLKKVKQ